LIACDNLFCFFFGFFDLGFVRALDFPRSELAFDAAFSE
jgi:hypothetical protein